MASAAAEAKNEILLTLSIMGYGEEYISRAIKLHTKSKFGTDYSLSLLVDIIAYLKQKDADKGKSEEFKPHFSTPNELLIYLNNHNTIDYRFENGRYILCKIIERDFQSQHRILLHPASQPLSETKHNKYCFIYKEYTKLAPPKSISLRKLINNKHPLYNIKQGDYLDINPMHKHGHSGWKQGRVVEIDNNSSQVKVLYFAMNKNHSYWIHLENKQEAAPFNTKHGPLKHTINAWNDKEIENNNDNTHEIALCHIPSDIMQQLSKFGYTAEKIASAARIANNSTDINEINKILQQQDLRKNVVIDCKEYEEDIKSKPMGAVFRSTIAPKSDEFRIHIAVDFGTDGIALSYVIDGVVSVHQPWTNTKYTVNVKPKAIILLDENENLLAFGEDAKLNYISNKWMSDKWMLFERFKMALYENVMESKEEDESGKIGIEDTLTATNGKKVKSGVVFGAAFKHLQQMAKKYLKMKGVENLNDSDIQWIITVPAIWDDTAKYKMRQWSIDAGLVDENIEDQCKIVYEPDCASLAIQKQIYEMKMEQRRNSITSDVALSFDDNKYNEEEEEEEEDLVPKFEAGDRYILIDAGGGTVDIACHELLGEFGEFGVKEILPPSGGPWGSCYIDDEYIKLLKDIFDDDCIEEFKKKNPEKYTQLLHNFELKKSTFYINPEQDSHAVTLPIDFTIFVQDKLEENKEDDVVIEDLVSSCTLFGQQKLVTLSGEDLQINVIAWKLMFGQVLNPIIEHVTNLLEQKKFSENCKHLCLVGGLSTSSYFQKEMETKFGAQSKYKLTLVTPQRPILSVVIGAAYFGITKNYIKARVLRYTYGEILSMSEFEAKLIGISSKHIQKYRTFNDYRKQWFVKNCFSIIAAKNEEIKTGQIKTIVAPKWLPLSSRCRLDIHYSAKREPKTHYDSHQLGSIVIEFDNNNESDMDVTLEFHFDDTLIKVVTYRSSSPRDKQIRYISNYK